MSDRKTIGVLFIEGFADWEYGLLAASAVEWFDAKTVALSPGARPVTSIGGFQLTPGRSIDAAENVDLDAIAVIGSDLWASEKAPDITGLLKDVAGRGRLVGGICAGTLALARAGLFENSAHTSNGRDWILEKLPGYAGAAHYRDVPYAVADGLVVSAPGSAPGTFALAFLKTLYPDQGEQIARMRAMYAREYADAS